MKRREFSKAATAAAALALTATAGCGGGGGGGGDGGSGGDAASASATSASGSDQAASPLSAEMAGPLNLTGLPMGTNLSGMEWAKPGLRYGRSSVPNLHFTVPRASDVAYLAANGFNKNRLPIQWELLQPMLHDTNANATAQGLIGAPGAFHSGYEAYITGVLDAHAAAGVKCIIDCHNYCRYQDFKFQPDGSVIGLTQPPEALLRPYTSDASQVQERIFALAPGATLTLANFTDFWVRVANRWKDHPGLGGYGLMNEPHDMPAPGSTVPSAGGEDLTIWPTFAQAAVHAIRTVDSATPIYVGGNEWQSAMSIAAKNPGWPLAGNNLVYDVHMYLDAMSNGYAFDFDTEVAKNFSAGTGNGSIDLDTGVKRLKHATAWAKAKGVKLALTEVGMPLDDPRWQEAFKRAVGHAREEGCEIYSWMGGNHWPARNYPINHVPGWHQNRTLEPEVAGPMKASAGIVRAALFDDGPGYAPAGTSVTITVYARGNLAGPVNVTVSSSNGGTLSKSVLTIPAGANGQDTFTYTSDSNRVATLTYSSSAGQVPPPRKVFSLSDPVAYAATNLSDAALAIIAKYSACKWEMADGHTDYMQGALASEGQPLRAVSDSGYGSSPGNAMDMVNWINKEMGPTGDYAVPVTRMINGRKSADVSAPNTFGLWCKKAQRLPGIQANPKNKVPYNIEDAHFAIAAVSVPGAANGVLFQASKAEDAPAAELSFAGGRPRAQWVDANGQNVQLTSSAGLAAKAPAVVSMTAVPGAQRLRVNTAVVGSSSAWLAPSAFTQMLIGWGFVNYYPRENFGGNVFSVITGKGAPSPEEMAVMEKYLGSTAGVAI
jgi:endoglucanase